jgi:MFS family permease
MPLNPLGLSRLRGVEAVLVAIAVDALGTGLFAPFSLLYFHVVPRLDLPTVGVALSIAAGLGLPMSFAAGGLIDRFGARRAIIAAELLQGAGFLSYVAVRNPWQLVVAAVVATTGLRLFWPAYLTYLAELHEDGRQDRGYALSAVLQNAGFGAGGLVAGLVVQFGQTSGYQALVVADGLSFLVAAALFWWRAPRPRPPAESQPRSGYRTVLGDRPFLGMTAANALFALCTVMLGVGLPVYATAGLHAQPWVVGAVFTLLTVTVIACQTLVVRRLESVRRTRALALAGLLWCAWSLLLALGVVVPQVAVAGYLLVVTLVYSAAEQIHLPTSSGLAAVAGPATARGTYMAVFQLSFNVANLIGPAFFTLLFARHPVAPWLALAALAMLAGMATLALERRLPAAAVRASG